MKKGALGVGLLLILFGSVIWHLPAQWVVHQLQKYEVIDFNTLPIGLETLQGSWHAGEGTLYRQDNDFPLLSLNWQLSGFSAWWGAPVVRLKLQDFNHLSQQLQAQVKLQAWQPQLSVQQLQAQLSLPTLVRWLSAITANPNLQLLADSQGMVIWHALHFSLPLSQGKSQIPWPQGLKVQGEILGLEVMKTVKIPKLTITLSQTFHQTLAPIQVTLKGGGKDWEITGKGELVRQGQKQLRYHYHIEVSSQPGTSLPEWAGLLMRKVTPNKAVLEQ